MNILIIGTGNVAFHLIRAFAAVPQVTLFIHGRNPETLDQLSSDFPAVTILSGYTPSETIDLALLAVKDDVLSQVYAQYSLPQHCLAAHTSGSQSVDGVNGKLAVFYPLQTFSKQTSIDWKRVPLLLEAGSEKEYEVLQQAARFLGAPFFETDETQRSAIHLAAVTACNFTNHLIGKAAELLNRQHIDYHLLQPLLEETIRKAFKQHPFTVQTGPAIRHDQSTIDKQLIQLQHDELLQKIYTDITESIQKTSTFTNGNK